MSMHGMSPTAAARPFVVQYPVSPQVSRPFGSAASYVSPANMPIQYTQVGSPIVSSPYKTPVVSNPFQYRKVTPSSFTLGVAQKPSQQESGAAEAAKCGHSIHEAAKTGNIQAIRYIQTHHPHSIHVYDETGQMPLHHAVSKGDLEMIKELLKHGADIEAVNHDGDTPLHHAVSEGHPEVVRLLLDKGADIHAKEKFMGGSTLHHAALHGKLEVLRTLLERRAELETMDRKHQTPLHVASVYGQLATAQLLLEYGAKPEAKDLRGCTPAALANKTGHQAMEELFY